MTKKQYLRALKTLGSIKGEKMNKSQLDALNDVMTYIEALKDYDTSLFYILSQKTSNTAEVKMRSHSANDWAVLFASIFVQDVGFMADVALGSAMKILKLEESDLGKLV
jgi:hypothetical protein